MHKQINKDTFNAHFFFASGVVQSRMCYESQGSSLVLSGSQIHRHPCGDGYRAYLFVSLTSLKFCHFCSRVNSLVLSRYRPSRTRYKEKNVS